MTTMDSRPPTPDVDNGPAEARGFRATWKRVLAFFDDALPMPPDQRFDRDWSGEPSVVVELIADGQHVDPALWPIVVESERRRRRLRLHLLEKRGKGGYR